MLWAWDLMIPISLEKKQVNVNNKKDHNKRLKRLEKLRDKGLI